MDKYELIDCTAVTMEGKGIEAAEREKQITSREILRPASLKGIAPKVDPCTGICVTAAELLEESCKEYDKTRIGLIIGTRTGNHKMARDYANKIRKGSVSSLMYSTSGYNMCAGITALSRGWKGPSLVFPDYNIKYSDLISISCNYLKKGDADIMVVGQVETLDDWGLGIFSVISLPNREGKVSFELISSSGNACDVEEGNEIDINDNFFSNAMQIYNLANGSDNDNIESITKFGESIIFRRK